MACYTHFCNDDTDQIHDETARQSRSAFGICLSVVSLIQIKFSKAPTKVGAFWFLHGFLAGSQAGKARDCYSRHAQVRILPASQF
jgi:hypothetical protein